MEAKGKAEINSAKSFSLIPIIFCGKYEMKIKALSVKKIRHLTLTPT
jgi:hypothetical protein